MGFRDKMVNKKDPQNFFPIFAKFGELEGSEFFMDLRKIGDPNLKSSDFGLICWKIQTPLTPQFLQKSEKKIGDLFYSPFCA